MDFKVSVSRRITYKASVTLLFSNKVFHFYFIYNLTLLTVTVFTEDCMSYFA